MSRPWLSWRASRRLTKALSGLGLTLDMVRSRPSLDFFRMDGESTSPGRPTDLDPSELLAFGVKRRSADRSAWCLLKLVASCQSVRTDRLHVAIAAALTGTACQLFDNSYGKNRDVFEHSLRDRFASVVFIDASPAARQTNPSLQ